MTTVQPTRPTAEAPRLERRAISPWSWQDAFGFAQAHETTRSGRTIYCAGQAAVDEDGRPLHAGDMRRQLVRALDNLEVVLHAADAQLADVVRLTYYTTDVPALFDAWDLITERLAANDSRPASTLLGVQALAFPELVIEIEATAVVTPIS
jgi:enamine deaminase RidA (YjgF/YER057c/UK114 family)